MVFRNFHHAASQTKAKPTHLNFANAHTAGTHDDPAKLEQLQQEKTDLAVCRTTVQKHIAALLESCGPLGVVHKQVRAAGSCGRPTSRKQAYVQLGTVQHEYMCKNPLSLDVHYTRDIIDLDPALYTDKVPTHTTTRTHNNYAPGCPLMFNAYGFVYKTQHTMRALF